MQGINGDEETHVLVPARRTYLPAFFAFFVASLAESS